MTLLWNLGATSNLAYHTLLSGLIRTKCLLCSDELLGIDLGCSSPNSAYLIAAQSD